MQKSREGYGKNWMHFVYKLDNLLGSIRVSNESSSVTPAIQYFNNFVQLRTFLTQFAIFDAFTDLYSELNHRESEKHYEINSEKVETWQGMIISPT